MKPMEIEQASMAIIERELQVALDPEIKPIVKRVLHAPAGMVQSHVIAMQGPFSRDFNAALYDQLRIRTMVSKDSGQPGGVADKVLPALERGIDVVMIERPKEDKR